jgi:hypothetical protein
MQCQGVARCESTMTKVTDVTCDICNAKNFLYADIFCSLVQIFQRSDGKTTSPIVKDSDGPVLAGDESDVASVEEGK